MSKKSLATKQHNKRNKIRTNKTYVEQKLSTVGLLEKLLRKSNHTFDKLETLLLAGGNNEQRRLKIHHNSIMAREIDKYAVRLEMKSTQLAHVTERLPQLLRRIEEFLRKSEELSDDTLSRGAQREMVEGLLLIACKIGRLITYLLVEERKRTGNYKHYECRAINSKHFIKSAALEDKAAVDAGVRIGQAKRTKASAGEYPRRTPELSDVMHRGKKDFETRIDFSGGRGSRTEGFGSNSSDAGVPW
jgi:hypothetical protein